MIFYPQDACGYQATEGERRHGYSDIEEDIVDEISGIGLLEAPGQGDGGCQKEVDVTEPSLDIFPSEEREACHGESVEQDAHVGV